MTTEFFQNRCSENKGADQLRGYLRLCFRICNKQAFLMTQHKYVFLIFSGAVGVKEITKRLHLTEITNRQWVVQGACAITGSGIGESMESLAKLVREFKGHKR